VDADQTPEFDVGEITPANQVTKVTLRDSSVDRERLEIEELGPRCRCCEAAANLPAGLVILAAK
jgi:hypothetical protein